jgi:hypothetical protein
MVPDDFREMVVDATLVGLKPGEWPETFSFGGRTWTKDHLTITDSSDVQCGEYMCNEGREWLVVLGN